MVRKLKEGDEYRYYRIGTNGICTSRVVYYIDIWVDEDGFLHNENNKPAKIHYSEIGHKETYLEYMEHGKLHNLFGPAVIWVNGLMGVSYFINGVVLSKYNWEIEVNRIKMLEEI